MKIKKGDTVRIIKGKDRGKTGKILRVYPDLNKVIIEGLNLFKKHRRPRQAGAKGEIVQISQPLSASNVMFICPNCSKAVKVSCRFSTGKKVRFCKKCDSALDK